MNNPHLVQNYCYSGMLACVWALTWERRDLIWNLISCHVSSVHLNMSSECESGRELVRDLSKKNGNLRDQEGFEIKGAITSHGRALLWTERRGYDPLLFTCYHVSGTSHGSHEAHRATPAVEEGCCLGKTVMGSGSVDENTVKVPLL